MTVSYLLFQLSSYDLSMHSTENDINELFDVSIDLLGV